MIPEMTVKPKHSGSPTNIFWKVYLVGFSIFVHWCKRQQCVI